jgi:uncharacterized OB-fold protein
MIMKELTAQEAKELGSKRLSKKTKKIVKQSKENQAVKAEWVYFTRPAQAWAIACSNCDYVAFKRTPYCPGCGAKMKGE